MTTTCSIPPGHVSADLSEAILSGNVRRAAESFTREGCLITPDRTVVHGRDAIAEILRQLSLIVVSIEVEHVSAVRGDDTVLSSERWNIRLQGPEGAYRRTSLATLVIRRVEDCWKLAIAAPWGWPGADQLVARPIASSGNESIRPM